MSGINFIKSFDFEYGKPAQLSPLVRRVVADNPGPFTYTGTGVYIVGTDEVCVIDPGPTSPAHMAAIDAALEGCTVSHVLVTHHHIDHSPLAAPLAKKHGCKVYGYGLQSPSPQDGKTRFEAGDDLSFKPDIQLADGDLIKGRDWTIEALHTPGHTSNHMCYALNEENLLFSGDHIMGWSTTVISPPDGDMADYLRSLERVLERNFDIIWPTHGPAIRDVQTFVQSYIDHRHTREAQILDSLSRGRSQIMDIVPELYAYIDKRLYPAAAHSVLAHLIHLVETGRARCDDAAGLHSNYFPV
ncbi:MBL fold metallo-hydrolase [Robiginitomaculum antarcticum]|uniref:MBL fold metallo-hydrolase n=1 Tax=Robiginitomaculum antarcticum TaxID=437507 RepID=UPI000374B63C|nr:MBL fold metallo-hydrolase [Robiginitomaculum antarcticum]